MKQKLKFRPAFLFVIGFLLLTVGLMNYSSTQAEDFGIEYVNDTTLKVFHVDQGWSGSWNYICLNGGCYPGTKVNGRYEREFGNVTLGQTYNIEFKVQDNATGQYIVQDSAVFTEPGSATSTPEPTNTSAPPTATSPQPTNTSVAPTATSPAPTNTSVPPTSTNPPPPTNTPVPSDEDFGFEFVNSTTMRVFHVDQGWSAGWHYLCVNGGCYPGSLVNGRYQRDFGGLTVGQTYNIEFKVEDAANGQYLVNKDVVFEDAGPPPPTNTPCANCPTPTTAPTSTPRPTNTPVPGAITLSFAERIRERHETNVVFDQYVPGYFDGGGLYEINLIDYPDRLEIHLHAPMDLTMVNFTHDVNACSNFCDPLTYSGPNGGFMAKHSPNGPRNDSAGDRANDFYITITDRWAQRRANNETVTFEFTPRKWDASGNHPQYYSSVVRYIAGEGRLSFQDEFPDARSYPGGPVTQFPHSDATKDTNAPFLEKQMHYSQAFVGISLEQMDGFLQGRRLFNVDFSSEEGNPAGPLLTQPSCADCHDSVGRGQPLDEGAGVGVIVKVASNSNPAQPHPDYGRLLDTASIGGSPEGTVTISGYETINRGGVALQKPIYSFSNLSGGSIQNFSPRVGPQVPGLGLLEAVDDATIEGFAAQQSGNISGEVNYVYSPATGQTEIGRYGWKAGAATIKDQVAQAYNLDMGITNPLFPNPDSGSSNGVELSMTDIDLVTTYMQGLAIPMRRHPHMDSYWSHASGMYIFDHNVEGGAYTITNAQVEQGEDLFMSIGCADCHIPEMQTGNSHPFPQFRNITIRPFTDMLLHDMGPDLADPGNGVHEGNANGSEWRTPPLWGLRLLSTVSGHTRYLHDGRAHTLEEAILWHGGEAESSRNSFINLSSGQKEALILFLNTQ